MSTAPSPAVIQQLQAHILKLSQNMDAIETKVMTDLGFSDIPAWWPDEAEIVLCLIARTARREATEEIGRTSQVIRARRDCTMADLAARLRQLDEKQLAIYAYTEAIFAGLAVGPERLGDEFRDAVDIYFPSLNEKFIAFCGKLSSLRDEFFALLPLYRILQSRPLELEVTLADLLPVNPHGDMIPTTSDVVRQLYELKRERMTLLEREAALRADLLLDVTSDQQQRAWEELRSLAGPLVNQVLNQRAYLNTITVNADILRNQSLVLRNVMRGVDVSIEDFVRVFERHGQATRMAQELTKEVDHLVAMFDCLKNLLDIGNASAGHDAAA